MNYSELQKKAIALEERLAELEEREADLLKRVNTSIRNFAGTFRVRSGEIKSGEYEEGKAGWRLTPTTAYLPNVEISGYLTVGEAGNLAYKDTLDNSNLIGDGIVEEAKLGTTVISGGYIKTSLLDVDDIFAQTITATGTITGGTIRTSASGVRVEMSSDEIRSYDSSNNLRVQLDTENLIFKGPATGDGCWISGTGYRKMTFSNPVTDIEFKAGELDFLENCDIKGVRDIEIDQYVVSDLIPGTNNAYDLGSSTRSWDKGYIRDLESRTLFLNPGTVVPSTKEGMIYFDSSTSKLRYYDGTNWKVVATE